ncbi:MAG: DUF2089 family protein [Oligoflexales bacterium]
MHLATQCPLCSGSLNCERYHCASCEISFEGKLASVELPNWSPEEWSFVKTFLSLEGNIQATGKMIGVSYPTVKQMLATVNKKLKEPFEHSRTPDSSQIQHILLDLAEGRMDSNAAANAVREVIGDNKPKSKK